MARIRSIHPDACDSDKLSECSDAAERTFWRLLTHLDDDGRAEDKPRLLAAKLYPLVDEKDAVALDDDLEELRGVGMLERYTVDGKAYLVAPTFGDWQNPRHPTASKLPSPVDPRATPTPNRRNPTADDGSPTAGEERSGGEREGTCSPGVDAAELTLVAPPFSSAAADGVREFEVWWQQYPRKVEKAKARAAYAKSRRQVSAETLVEALARQKAVWRRENRPKDKVPHATTWLNGERWADEDLNESPAQTEDDTPAWMRRRPAGGVT